MRRLPVRPCRWRRRREGACDLLGVQSLVWVPQGPDAPGVIHGAPCLAAADCRLLAALLARSPDLQPSAPLLCNEVQAASWGGRFPRLVNLLALQVTDQRTGGWVIALNKRERHAETTGPEGARPGGAEHNPACAAAGPAAPQGGGPLRRGPVRPGHEFRRSDAAL